MGNSKDKNRVFASVLLNLLEQGSKEYNNLCEVNPIFKSDMDFLKLRLNYIFDGNEKAEYDEINYKGYGPGKFMVDLYEPYSVSRDDGYWDWDPKARKSSYEVYDDLSKINVQFGNIINEYDTNAKTRRQRYERSYTD